MYRLLQSKIVQWIRVRANRSNIKSSCHKKF